MKRTMVIERATGVKYMAEEIEGGYITFAADGTQYKKLKESTFKKYFKPCNEVEEKEAQEQPTAEEEKAEETTEQVTEETAEATTSEPISDEKRQKMIDKIKKMLALAENNPSEEEALSAALQAHKLMVKYNIHDEDVTLEEIKEDEIGSVFSEQPHDSHLMGWRKSLGLVVSKAFRCKVYMSGKDVVFRGYKEDAKVAMDVYLTLYSVGHKIAKKAETKARTETGSAKGIYTSVATGFVKGVSDALNEQCTALLVVIPKAVEEEYAEFSKNFTKSSKVNTKVSDYEAFQHGYKEGKESVKSRSIEKKNK